MLVQKNMVKRATLVRNLKMNTKQQHDDLVVKVKINSYKDGSLEVGIESDNFVWETELIENTKKEVEVKVVSVLNKLIIGKALLCSNKLNLHLKDALDFARKLKGELTHGYEKHECHAMLILSK